MPRFCYIANTEICSECSWPRVLIICIQQRRILHQIRTTNPRLTSSVHSPWTIMHCVTCGAALAKTMKLHVLQLHAQWHQIKVTWYNEKCACFYNNISMINVMQRYWNDILRLWIQILNCVWCSMTILNCHSVYILYVIWEAMSENKLSVIIIVIMIVQTTEEKVSWNNL